MEKGSSLLSIRLVRFGLFSQLPKPVDELNKFGIEEDRIFNAESKGGEVLINLIVDDIGVIAKMTARDYVALSDVSIVPSTKRLLFQFKCYPEDTQTAIRSKRQIARQILFTSSIVWKRWKKSK